MIKPATVSLSGGPLSAVRAWLVRALVLLIAFACLVNAAGEANAATNEALEHRIKAAYLYKFLSYIEWPPDRFTRADSPFVVGVTGGDEIYRELVRITGGRTASGRAITVRQLRSGDSLAGMHVLYVAGDELPGTATAVRGLLTITDNASSVAHAGSVINFRFIGGKVRFEVSLPAAERNDLRLSSRMLSVATTVHSEAS